MGRWLEVVRDAADGGAGEVLGGTAPYPLLDAAELLGRQHRSRFPLLERVSPRLGDAYVDESLWLDAADAGRLLDELRRLRRIATRQEFLPGLDGALLRERWNRYPWAESFEEYLDTLDGLCALAARDGHRLHLTL